MPEVGRKFRFTGFGDVYYTASAFNYRFSLPFDRLNL